MLKVIERQREINDVVHLWEKICLGETKNTFREFFGVPGIGKTELSKQIKAALEDKGAKCAHLDFDPVQNPWGGNPTNEKVLTYYVDSQNLFIDLLVAWNHKGISDLNISLYSNKNNYLDPHQFATRIIERLKRLPQNETMVLICDETDHIQWERLPWFEHNFIAPLIKSNRCLVIWIGRREKQWPKELTSIKLQVKSSELNPFTPDDIAEQINHRGIILENNDLLTELYDITYGHPMAVKVTIDHLQGVTEKTNFQELIVANDIKEKVIKEYILKDNSLSFDQAQKLSLLRIIDVSLLRALSKNSSDTSFSYGKITNELRANPLGNVRDKTLLKKSVSKLFRQHFLISQPNEYLNTQAYLVDECTRLCNTFEEGAWLKFAIESLFHAACANIVAENYDLTEILTTHLQNLQQLELIDNSKSLLINLEGRIRNDKEIEELLGKEEVDKLLAIIEKFSGGENAINNNATY